MKIISKHKDYYDYLGQIYGIDQKIVYYRNPSTHDCVNLEYRTTVYEPNEHRNNIFVPINLTRFSVWFCDKIYPAIEVSYKVGHVDQFGNPMYGSTDYSHTFYDFEELSSKWGDNINWPSWDEERLERHFSLVSDKKLNTQFGSPQLVTVSNDRIELDIILKDYEFQKVMTPEQAFQKVSMFIGAKPDPPQQIPTEMNRFEAKGFDKKTSFRNVK